jgi:hypothetical protein
VENSLSFRRQFAWIVEGLESGRSTVASPPTARQLVVGAAPGSKIDCLDPETETGIRDQTARARRP